MEINGLPAHILLVHAVVGLVPLTAFLVIADAVWPWLRARIGLLAPIAALVTLILVPITTQAGEWLQDRVPRSDLVRQHAELGDSLLPFAFGMLVLSAGLWALRRWWTTGTAAEPAQPRRPGGRRVAFGLISVLAVLVSLGAVVQVYRIGDSGARAAWEGRFSTTPAPRPEHRG